MSTERMIGRLVAVNTKWALRARLVTQRTWISERRTSKIPAESLLCCGPGLGKQPGRVTTMLAIGANFCRSLC
jgi:hypothetical protein